MPKDKTRAGREQIKKQVRGHTTYTKRKHNRNNQSAKVSEDTKETETGKETDTAHKKQNISTNTTLQTKINMITPKKDTGKTTK